MTERSLTLWHVADAPEPVRFAAAELGNYLRRVSPVEPTVAVAPAGAWDQLELRVGRASGSPAALGPLAPELATRVRPVPAAHAVTPGVDAFLWRTGGGWLSLAGTNGRSVLFAAYDVLEELGCRFYGLQPEDEVIPNLTADELFGFLSTPAEVFEQATFPYREHDLLEMVDLATTVREVNHIARLRMNVFLFSFDDFLLNRELWQVVRRQVIPEIVRRGLLVGVGEHGAYPLLLPPERYAAEHPDWYVERQGQRRPGFRVYDERTGALVGRYQFCTEHPEARAAFLDNLEQFLRDNPEIQVLYPCPEDVAEWCGCPRCSAIPVSERYMSLDNAIAERAARVRPGIRVIHLVYANHIEPPEAARPSPHLDVDFAPWGRDFRIPFSALGPGSPVHYMPAGVPPYTELADRWAAICRETGAGFIKHCKWMRYRWLTFRLLPLPHLQADLRHFRGLGAGGFDFQMEQEGFWVKHLNSYVVARLAWDLEQSLDGLLDDYFHRYWGSLGPAIHEVYDDLARALPDLRYARNPTYLIGIRPGRAVPPADQLTADERYLAEALVGLTKCARRAAALRREGTGDDTVERRLAKLEEAIAGAIAGLEVSLAITRFHLARGSANARSALAEARIAHDRFVAFQMPERIQAGTLWTGRWSRDELLAAWERELAGVGE